MKPHQTAPGEQSDQSPYCLQSKPPKYISIWVVMKWREKLTNTLDIGWQDSYSPVVDNSDVILYSPPGQIPIVIIY